MKTLLDWFRDRRSRTIVNLMREHLVKVIDTNQAFIEAVRTTLATPQDKEKILTSIDAVHLNEKAGDSIKADLVQEISQAAFLPMRNFILRLTRAIDSIANWNNAASKNLQLALELGFPLPEEALQIEEKMLKFSAKSIHLIREAIEMLAQDPEQSIKICAEIETVETKVDELFFEVRKDLLSRELSPAALITHYDLLLGIEQANDYCAMSADSIVAIIMTGR
ncbi:MAG: DUF47 domain-containing protein [Promethearchaeota archaeon]